MTSVAYEETILHTESLDMLDSIRARMIGTVAALAGLGLVLVYSASAIRALHFGWELTYLSNQARWLVIGIGGFLLASRIHYRILLKCWLPILLLTLGLLVAVRIPGVGTNVRGAYRWFRFAGFSVQPSEIAKIGLTIAVAALLTRQTTPHLHFWKGVLPAALVIAAGTGLIVIEPDFGTAALIAGVLTALLIIGGARWWHIVLLGSAGAPPVLFYGLTRFDHIRERVLAWISGSNTGAGWQPWMSKVALGSGGLTGTGLGQGSAKLYYLPDAHTDFIFAIAGQELGLIGTTAIVLLFSYFVYLGLMLVRYAPDRFGALLAFGLTCMIGLQAAFNIAVVTASIPPKGISLPFVSFGGSGLCVSLAAVGILISITRHPHRHAPTAEEA